MKSIVLIGLVSLIFIGCETGEKKDTLGTNSFNQSSHSSTQTSNLYGDDFISFMYANENNILSASDCLKLTGQEWSDLYGQIIYSIAPATPMAKSIDSCRGVKFGVEAGYSLEQMSREHIAQGWLGAIVQGYNIDSSPSYSPQSQKLTLEKCMDMYGAYSEIEFEYARSIYGDNPPLAETCYQAFYADPNSMFNADYYIGIYNGQNY